MHKCRWTWHLWLKIRFALGSVKNVYCEANLNKKPGHVNWRCNFCGKILERTIG